jgi:hypothetical protein
MKFATIHITQTLQVPIEPGDFDANTPLKFVKGILKQNMWDETIHYQQCQHMLDFMKWKFDTQYNDSPNAKSIANHHKEMMEILEAGKFTMTVKLPKGFTTKQKKKK